MKTTLHRKFIASVTATALAITAFGTSPARAGDYDTERALAALLGLAVIGAVIAEDRKNDKRRSEQVYKEPPRAKPNPRPLPPRARKAVLPERCLRHWQTDRGTRRMMGERCMQRHYRHVNQLPRQCERRVWTDRGARYGWGVRCLRKNGYQLARH